MNRYKSSTKIKPESSNTIIFEDDFQQANQLPRKLKDLRYKSIPSKAELLVGEQILQQKEVNSRLKQKPFDDLKIIHAQSSQIVKLDNFFGSKKILERRVNPIVELQPNPQARQSRLSVEQQDSNSKLARLIQKQIEDRQKWQRLAELKQNQMQPQVSSQSLNELSQSNVFNPLLVIKDVDSLKKMTSKNKLQKINNQKYSALNLEKNDIFKGKVEQQDYANPTLPTKQLKQQNSPTMQKKNRSVSQLKPLKKKISTFQVLNQLEMLKNKEQRNFNTADANSSNKQKNQSAKIRIIGPDIQDMLAFNTQQFAKEQYIEGTLSRNKQGFCNTLFPEYRIIFDNVNIIYAKKTMKGYDIMMDPSHPSFISTKKLATVKGNFLGSCYNVYEGENQSEILATIFYNPNSKQATREVQLYVKNKSVKYWDLDRDIQTDNTLCSLKDLYLQGDNKAQSKIKKYINKQPFFNQKTGTYSMDFGGKVTVLSVKNVILLDADNPNDKVMVFGKTDCESFYLRAEYPLSPVVIMGYLMTSFNFKFVTQ